MNLIQYEILNWEIANVGSDKIRASLSFRRIFKNRIFTIFIPSLTIIFVSQATLYFKSEHFKTSIPVAITSMLVMYTLYQSVSNKLPPTSYLKLLDYWLISGLIFPFFVFMTIALIEHLP